MPKARFHIVESGIPIDLLFTDVVMPGKMEVTELARKARLRLPGLAVLFTSGYTEEFDRAWRPAGCRRAVARQALYPGCAGAQGARGAGRGGA